ncbi:MAG: UDP-N-acetylmuramoyl-L-alanine--D-glutamate ligase [Candidatus Marinimicrobia bacterium]|nr:UDP-N-acetylmuramoyl-L-alanine--D-glutamate ligase [Candidatus Neomarinimicrobiota bacterium]
MINIKNKNITVLGAKRSGIAVAKLLAHFGAEVLLSDINENAIDKNTINSLEKIGINIELGKHGDDIFLSDMIILSPGIPSTIQIVESMSIAGVPILSEIEMAYELTDSKIIAITGSNGKTTTTELITDILNKSDVPAVACGNIGLAFSEAIYNSLNEKNKPVFVVEISSFQLENILNFKPNIALLLNITPDHLDRYDSFEDYANTKARIFENQNENDIAIINSDDKESIIFTNPQSEIINISMKEKVNKLAYFDDNYFNFFINSKWHRLEIDEIKLIGEHNKYNILFAFIASQSFIKNEFGTKKSLSTFKAIEHRIELCGEIDGVKFYNDSKATNTDSVKVALKSFNNPIHLILGGKDKDTNFSDLQNLIDEKVKTVYSIGETSKKIESQLNNIELVDSKSLENAMKKALQNANQNEIILLSPASSSYDQYKNFEKRGEDFKRIFNNLKKEKNTNESNK